MLCLLPPSTRLLHLFRPRHAAHQLRRLRRQRQRDAKVRCGCRQQHEKQQCMLPPAPAAPHAHAPAAVAALAIQTVVCTPPLPCAPNVRQHRFKTGTHLSTQLAGSQRCHPRWRKARRASTAASSTRAARVRRGGRCTASAASAGRSRSLSACALLAARRMPPARQLHGQRLFLHHLRPAACAARRPARICDHARPRWRGQQVVPPDRPGLNVPELCGR